MTPADVVNQAIEYSGNQASVTYTSGTWGPAGASAANAAAVLYVPTWQMVARLTNPDFARLSIALSTQAGGSIPPPWTMEYVYPADCLRMRQVRPAAGSYNPLDPQPIRANVGIDIITSVPTKVIFTNLASALGVYTTSNVTEDNWDDLFLMAVVRQLSNPLSMALEGRPDFAKELLAQAQQYEQIAEFGDDSVSDSL